MDTHWTWFCLYVTCFFGVHCTPQSSDSRNYKLAERLLELLDEADFGTGSEAATDDVHLSKRQQGCTSEYRKLEAETGVSHTLCKPIDPQRTDPGVTFKEKNYILNLHNDFRRNVDPPAKNMEMMYWDNDLAEVAQHFAEQCPDNHDAGPARYNPAWGSLNVGQNLAWSTRTRNWEWAVTAWHAEVSLFRYGGNNNYGVVGHYTQVVGDHSVRIGCGYAYCPNSRIPSHYVCNYGPGYRNVNQPYQAGSSCARCPGHCNNKLCDCGGKMCGKNGVLDLKSCQCQCKQPYGGEVCDEVVCPKADHDRCKWWTANDCRYINVPPDCPYMCGLCKKGDYKPGQENGGGDSGTGGTGNQGTGDSGTDGDQGTGGDTGDQGTGDQGTDNQDTGDQNTGDQNTGTDNQGTGGDDTGGTGGPSTNDQNNENGGQGDTDEGIKDDPTDMEENENVIDVHLPKCSSVDPSSCRLHVKDDCKLLKARQKCPALCGMCQNICPGRYASFCLYEGMLQNDCTCRCSPDFTGDRCDQYAKCPASDYFKCGSDEYRTNKYVLENCHLHVVKFRCPIMCNLCDSKCPQIRPENCVHGHVNDECRCVCADGWTGDDCDVKEDCHLEADDPSCPELFNVLGCHVGEYRLACPFTCGVCQ